MRTAITDLLGIDKPIIGGTMAWITDADFTAAISAAGGLGVLASANYAEPDSLGEALDRIKDLTDRPTAVNLNLFPAMRPVDNNLYLDVMLHKGVGIVETSGHAAPVELATRFKESGLIWIHKCVGPRYALKAKSLGADAVTVVGYENGGATGRLDIGTLVLVPRVAGAVDLPLIGGGGVSDGRGLAAVLALGAGAAIIGTRLLLTAEAPLHPDLKQALLAAGETDTRLVMRSIGSTHRVWANSAAQRTLDMEAQGAGLAELLKVVGGDNARRMYATGDLEAGIISCGQGVGLIDHIPTVAELFQTMVDQAQQTINALAGA